LDINSEESRATPTERLNYYNYFTEVEEEFVRRRGKPLLISPLDWALIESWKNAGIPLHVVLRAINQAFDAYDARPRKYRKVNSVFYCQQEVESTFADYRLAQVGAGPEGEQTRAQKRASKRGKDDERATPFPASVLLDFISRSDQELRQAAALASESGRREIESAIERARARLLEISREVESSPHVDAESIERDLDAIDRMMLDAVIKTSGEDVIRNMRAEAESQLSPYRKKMDKSIYNQTVQNFLARRMRETIHVPRLSLFYL
jgi:hypothetical protein